MHFYAALFYLSSQLKVCARERLGKDLSGKYSTVGGRKKEVGITKKKRASVARQYSTFV